MTYPVRPAEPDRLPIQPSPIAVSAVYLAAAASTARALALTADPRRLPWIAGLHGGFVLLFTLVLWRPGLPAGLRHAYFAVQSSIVLGLLSLDPELDFVTSLFVLLCYQSALVFGGRARWAWIGACVALTGVSLMAGLGPARGLALGLVPMAIGVVLPACAIANGEAEADRARSEALRDESEAAHRRLQAYAAQAEELAAVEARNRLARELHDSVSQTMFGILLAVRSAQVLLDRGPERVRPELERLQALTQSALAQMRGLIDELRPKS